MLKETSQKYDQVDAIKNVITLDWLIANNMQVKFEIAGIQLKESEAKTLLSIGNEMPTVTVDLMDHVDSKLLDSSKLFNLSIEKKHPELASLAAKLAITTPELSKKKKQPRNRHTISKLAVKKISLDEALDQLCNYRSLKNVGAAMVIHSLVNGKCLTIREIAVKQVNDLWNQDVDVQSEIFSGFKRVQGEFKPFVAKPQKGLLTYHSSPVYGALRDGTAFLKQTGFVKVEESVEYGSADKKLTGTENHLQRKVYRLELTEAGDVLADTWGDLDEFILKFWNSRKA
tara:strand:- start:1722 stop:2579 length:858 start_codon:yes stop_codon:yes gene_type:complete